MAQYKSIETLKRSLTLPTLMLPSQNQFHAKRTLLDFKIKDRIFYNEQILNIN